ncbi:MAG: hydantoinase/oxoprolinase family protein [Haloarculaceae archaeon]
MTDADTALGDDATLGDETAVGVDVGGTFTDVLAITDGQIEVTKTPSTPDAPAEAVLDGLEKLRSGNRLDFERVSALGHGTTVATNAVLEGEWADTALVTTAGFRDALEIGRQARPDIYDFQAEKPTPVVERDRRYGVTERVDDRGRVHTDLDEAEVRGVARDLAETDVESVAVSFLFAFENDDHERRVAEILAEETHDVPVSRSSRVLPEIREYERTLATALNAALEPVVSRYLDRFRSGIEATAIEVEPKIMQSNGGIITAAAASERPVHTLLSGPAAGVQAATHVAGLTGVEDLLTLDMGGTSCDVSLVRDGDPLVSTDVEVGEYPVPLPMIDVHTVGAGGGSVAWLDEGGALRVGPGSAGADPGPICYGRGGTSPTVTDAHLLLGRLNPDAFLSGELDVEVGDVHRIVEADLAEPLGTTVEDAAAGVLEVANANMERALRVVSVERGHDPREFGLVAFGGAGPLHAAALAERLDIPRVLVPRSAGVLSALGLLVSDVVYDYSTSRVRPWTDVDPAALQAEFEVFVEAGRDRLASEGLPADAIAFDRSVDLRYAGQSFDLSVPVPAGDLDADTKETLRERFHDRHRRRYGHAAPDEPIDLVTIRTRARGAVEPPALRPARTAGSVDDAITGMRSVRFGDEWRETRVLDRERLPTNGHFDGPAIVESPETTVLVRPGQRAEVDDHGSIVLEVDG